MIVSSLFSKEYFSSNCLSYFTNRFKKNIDLRNKSVAAVQLIFAGGNLSKLTSSVGIIYVVSNIVEKTTKVGDLELQLLGFTSIDDLGPLAKPMFAPCVQKTIEEINIQLLDERFSPINYGDKKLFTTIVLEFKQNELPK